MSRRVSGQATIGGLAGIIATKADCPNCDVGGLGALVLWELAVDEMKRVMEINVWANKTVLDWLHNSAVRVDQVVMISSGAAVLGNRGWGGYALSKAALNMLARLYAHEFPQTHLCALAPGIIDTAMMDYLCEQAGDHRTTIM